MFLDEWKSSCIGFQPLSGLVGLVVSEFMLAGLSVVKPVKHGILSNMKSFTKVIWGEESPWFDFSPSAGSGFDNWSIKRVDPLCPKLRLYSSNNSLCHSNVAIFLDIIQHEKSESISGNRMLEQGKAKSIITHLPSEAKLCNTKYLAPLCRKLHSVNRPVRIWGSLPLSQGKKQQQ